MNLNELIEKLTALKKIHGGDIPVMLDDLYTPASLNVNDIYTENREGYSRNEWVLVIRD